MGAKRRPRDWWRRSLPGLAALCVAPALAGCQLSGSEAQTPPTLHPGIPLRGRVLDSDGRPAKGVTVWLRLEVTGGDVLGSLGLACWGDGPCGTQDTAVTNDQGMYDLGYPASLAPESRAVVVQAGWPARPQDKEFDTTLLYLPVIASKGPDLPPIRRWSSQLSFSGGPDAGKLNWRNMDASYGSDFEYVSLVQTDVATYGGGTGPSPMSVDPRNWEDVPVKARVTAKATLDGFKIEYRTAPADMPANRPLSRGRPCEFQSGTASVGGENVRLIDDVLTVDKCELTDGDFNTSPQFDDKCPVPVKSPSRCQRMAATIDLGSQQPVTAIVIRGCYNDCYAEVSADRSRWRRLPPLASNTHTSTAPAGTQARFVRVITADWPFFFMKEVSVW